MFIQKNNLIAMMNECDYTETPTTPFHPEPVFDFPPQGGVYALELVLGGGNNGGGERDESFVLVGDRLLHDMAGVVSLRGDLGVMMGGKAAILGSEMTEAIESILLDVGAGEGGVVRSTSCVPVQCNVKLP